MRESVIYQEIHQEGKQEGKQEEGIGAGAAVVGTASWCIVTGVEIAGGNFTIASAGGFGRSTVRFLPACGFGRMVAGSSEVVKRSTNHTTNQQPQTGSIPLFC